MGTGSRIKGLTIALMIIQIIAISIIAIAIAEIYENGALGFAIVILGSVYICAFVMLFFGLGELLSIQGQMLEIVKENNKKQENNHEGDF